MRILFIFTILFFFTNCSLPERNGIRFEIKNTSNEVLKEIKIYTLYCDQSYNNIKPKETIKGFLRMDCKNIRTEGAYNLKVIRENNEIEYSGEGYYSGFGPSFGDCKLKFDIQNDTILSSIEKCKFFIF